MSRVAPSTASTTPSSGDPARERVAPVAAATREFHSSDMPIDRPAIEVLSEDRLLANREHEEIQVVKDAYIDLDYAQMLAFMEESVTIMLDRGREEESPEMYDFYVNGQAIWIPVEKPVRIKRKYLEVIARAVPYDIRTKIKDETGERPQNLVVRHTHTKFPFSVIKDSERGLAWLAKIRSETR